ncbi:hypothetical protein A3A39_03850 [Candidatus Kaiserbacteria bacterium RIFCSPLOWO2_01_FULL_54_13]|uniref:Uncharacterized protein n=1 Tax=Candidatus Kaiserbacteria bacterium RIFCSPLOWO2_01_FULL_54_13 TaxID=1798512 RepID=A0A1F6F014_9BACT|nr:MAG: hypothetical protein A3A39_03850 [Candidatus Kaiserbacteria bacterium RIFCSPLOWO2_01_FULL_54_13]
MGGKEKFPVFQANSEENPLSSEQVKKTFPTGVLVHECRDGLVLLSGPATDSVRMWADLKQIVIGENLIPRDKYVGPQPSVKDSGEGSELWLDWNQRRIDWEGQMYKLVDKIEGALDIRSSGSRIRLL